MDQVAFITMTKSNFLNMTNNYQGKVLAILTKFRKTLQNLRDAKQPYSNIMAKSMLLFKIKTTATGSLWMQLWSQVIIVKHVCFLVNNDSAPLKENPIKNIAHLYIIIIHGDFMVLI